MISNLKSNIYKLLSSAGIIADDVSGLEDLFQDESPYVKPFSKLETQYLQMSYYKKYLGFVVSTCMYDVCSPSLPFMQTCIALRVF